MRNVMAAQFHKRRSLSNLRKITVRQKTGNHTVTFLDYEMLRRNEYLLPPENTPVTIRYGLGANNVDVEYGYVNHYETTVGSDNKTLTRMVVLGTSKPMNGMTSSTWSATSRSAIARDIATRHRMRSVIHDHPYLVENWATGNRTDFQALRALADEAGYDFWVDGATVYFLDPERIVTTASSMSVRAVPPKDVHRIQVLGGSNIPGEIEPSRRQVQYGLDYRTNEFFTATSGDPVDPTKVSGASVNTYSEAQEVADSQTRRQGHYYTLRAEVEGDVKMRPGALSRFNSGRINTDQAGLWVASEAVHEVTSNTYTTELVASRGRDQRPLSRTRTTSRGITSRPRAVVRDGLIWESALQEHVHV